MPQSTGTTGRPTIPWPALVHPIVPIRPPTRQEKAEFERTLAGRGGPRYGAAAAPFDDFARTHETSPWTPAVLINLAVIRFEEGRFTKCLDALGRAWRLSSGTPGADPTLTAVIGAEYARALTRFGRTEELSRLLAQLAGRRATGRSRQLLEHSRDALWAMENHPERAFRCGPNALIYVWRALRPDSGCPDRLLTMPSSPSGTSLADLTAAAQDVGLELRPRRSASPPAVPCVAHLRVGHFVAVLGHVGDRLLIADPTLGNPYTRTIAVTAFCEEASGYYLARPEPGDYTEVPAGDVVGRGQTNGNDEDATSADDQQDGGNCGGAPGSAEYTLHSLLASLYIKDTPLVLTPPVGPRLEVRVAYSQRDVSWPQVPDTTNLGPGWNLEWVSWLTERFDTPDSVSVKKGLGGTEHHEIAIGGTYVPERRSRRTAERVSAGNYVVTSSDGSSEVFDHPTTGTFPRRVLLTRHVTGEGVTTLFLYDDDHRLTEVRRPLAASLYRPDDPGTYASLTLEYRSDTPAELPQFRQVATVADGSGRSASFAYDAEDRLTEIVDPCGGTSAFGYDDDHGITSLTTARGRTEFDWWQTDGFSGSGRARDIIARDATGDVERIRFTEDPDAGIPSRESAWTLPGMRLRNSILYARNSFYWSRKASAASPNVASGGALTPADFANAKVYHWLHVDGYSAAGPPLESVKVPGERRTWFTYEGQDVDPMEVLPVTISHEQSTLAGTSEMPVQVGRRLDDGTDQIYRMLYNRAGNLTCLRYPDHVTPDGLTSPGYELRFDYGDDGRDLVRVRRVAARDAAGDATGWLTVREFADHERHHLPRRMTDENGGEWSFAYNEAGQLLRVRDPLGRVTELSYGTADGVPFPEQEQGSRAGLLVEMRSLVPNEAGSLEQTDSVRLVHDARCRVTELTLADGSVVRREYDALDRLTRTDYPDGSVETVTYDGPDPIEFQLRSGGTAHAEYDHRGQLTSLTLPGGRTHRFEWCLCGSLQAYVDPAGHRRTWTYDVAGRLTAMTLPDGARWSYEYDLAGRLVREVSPTGRTRELNWRPDGLIAAVVAGDPADGQAPYGVRYDYDDFFPRPIRISTDDQMLTLGWSHPTEAGFGGNLLTTVRGPRAGQRISYDHDTFGRLVARSYGGVTEHFEYRPDGRVGRVRNPLGLFEYRYDPATGRLLEVSSAAGGELYAHGDGGDDFRLHSSTTVTPGGRMLVIREYGYDENGRIAALDHARAGRRSQTGYTYDAAGALATAELSGAATGDPGSYTYGYDDAGLRTSASGPGEAETLEYDASGRLARAASDGNELRYSYDADGNRVGEHRPDGSVHREFAWDAHRRVVGYTTPDQAGRFEYDPLGRRVAERRDGALVREWLWDGDVLRMEHDLVRSTVRHFLPQGEHVTGPFGTTSLLYVRDHLGTPRECLDGDGVLTSAHDHGPFGTPAGGSGREAPAIGFAGMHRHDDSGLLLTMHRPYDPATGSWLCRDLLTLGPAELQPRPPGDAGGGPPRLNLRPGGDYAYCSQDPVNFHDPLGLSDQAVCGPADPSDPPPVSTPAGTDPGPPPAGTQPLGYVAAGGSWFDSHSAKRVKLLMDLIKSLLGKPIQKPPPPPPPQIIRQIPKSGGGPGGGMLIIFIDPELIMRRVDPCGTLFPRDTPVPASCFEA